MPWRVVMAAGLALAGAGPAVAEAERPWVEVRSEHFQVLSDAGDRAARDTALRFEQIRAAFASLGSSVRLDSGQPVTVIAARDEKSLGRLLPAYFEKKGAARPAGVFVPAGHRVFVVLREDVDDESEGRHSVLFHEYVHLLQSLNFRTLPVWLSEGMAEFYAYTSVQKDRLLVGRAAPWHIALLREKRLVPLDEFFAVDHASRHYNEADRASIFYAQAWAVTHWLILGNKGANRARLQKFLDRLDAGATLPEAARDGLGAPDVLRREVETYLQNIAFYMQQLPPVAVQVASWASRPVPAGEMAAWRALVHLPFGRKDDARRAIEESLRLMPDLALGHEANALLLTREAHLPEARTAAAEAIKRDPKSLPALMLAGSLALMPGGAGPPEAVRLLEAATALAPAYGMAAMSLAQAKTAAGAPAQETLRLARRAAELWPSNLAIQFMLASQLLRNGDQAAAERAAQRALALATTDEEKAAGRLLKETIKSGRPPARTVSGTKVSPAEKLALQRTSCDNGDVAACVTVGWMLEQGEGATADLPAAAMHYRKACEAGNARGCNNLGLVYQFAKAVPKDLAQAQLLYERACAAGDGPGCMNLGDLIWRGGAQAKDEAKGADFYEKSCAVGYPSGCRLLGWCFDHGRGRTEDAKRAFELFKQGCDSADAMSCEYLGWAYARGRGVGKDLEQAVALFDKACAGDEADACVALGEWLGQPEVGRDFARAAKAFDRACQGGEQKGCAALAGLYAQGLGVAMDPAKAESLASTACGKGSPHGCAVVATMHAEKDPAKAVTFFTKACDGDLLSACTLLAFHHMGGRGVPQSMPRAAALFEKACEGGDGQACHHLAEMARYGGTGAPDPRRAAALRKKACAAGYQAACAP
jgi:uncharacterized protein